MEDEIIEMIIRHHNRTGASPECIMIGEDIYRDMVGYNASSIVYISNPINNESIPTYYSYSLGDKMYVGVEA